MSETKEAPGWSMAKRTSGDLRSARLLVSALAGDLESSSVLGRSCSVAPVSAVGDLVGVLIPLPALGVASAAAAGQLALVGEVVGVVAAGLLAGGSEFALLVDVDCTALELLLLGLEVDVGHQRGALLKHLLDPLLRAKVKQVLNLVYNAQAVVGMLLEVDEVSHVLVEHLGALRVLVESVADGGDELDEAFDKVLEGHLGTVRVHLQKSARDALQDGDGEDLAKEELAHEADVAQYPLLGAATGDLAGFGALSLLVAFLLFRVSTLFGNWLGSGFGVGDIGGVKTVRHRHAAEGLEGILALVEQNTVKESALEADIEVGVEAVLEQVSEIGVHVAVVQLGDRLVEDEVDHGDDVFLNGEVLVDAGELLGNSEELFHGEFVQQAADSALELLLTTDVSLLEGRDARSLGLGLAAPLALGLGALESAAALVSGALAKALRLRERRVGVVSTTATAEFTRLPPAAFGGTMGGNSLEAKRVAVLVGARSETILQKLADTVGFSRRCVLRGHKRRGTQTDDGYRTNILRVELEGISQSLRSFIGSLGGFLSLGSILNLGFQVTVGNGRYSLTLFYIDNPNRFRNNLKFLFGRLGNDGSSSGNGSSFRDGILPGRRHVLATWLNWCRNWYLNWCVNLCPNVFGRR
ncbi:DUF4159 domain-containing protein [Babesia caballi]|uniref:DUF4159 domain-containing protein n=1 Tax=Babesia caballi TaxID=5871 RepID=A0AAV4M006_BABCB|nr:DUF4159 domain-containing protein [Babesia caballi]